MDKNSIKKFAVWARRELITRVSQRAVQYEITEKGYGEYDADSVNGRVMSASEKSQRKALIDQIRAKGYGGGSLYMVQPFLCASIYGSERIPT